MKLIMLSNGMAPEKAILETNGGKFVEVEAGTTGNVSVRVYPHDTDRYGEVYIFKADDEADPDAVRWFITWQVVDRVYYNGSPAGAESSTGAVPVYSRIKDHCVCQDCVTPLDERRIELDEVSVWEEGSDGWEGPMTCDRCGRDLGVIVSEEDGG